MADNKNELDEQSIKEKKRMRIVRISLVVLFLLVCFTFFYDRYLYKEEHNTIEEMKKEAKISEQQKTTEEQTDNSLDITPSDEVTEANKPPYVSPIDFEYWKKINPDVIGYIKVPDTNIDYPILYDANDNERYLHESIDGKQTIHGSIYLDSISKPNFTSRNNMVYGHNMKDGSMFKDVVKYKDFNFFKKHNKAYIYLPDREIELRIIAAYYGKPDGQSRRVNFLEEQDFADFAKERLSHTQNIDTLPDAQIDGISQLFCLVTCSYEFDNARTFLYCINEKDYRQSKEQTLQELAQIDAMSGDDSQEDLENIELTTVSQ